MGKDDQGIFATRYAVVPRTLVFLFHKDKLLLIKGSPQKRIWANKYNALGGHIEKGEDALAAARRELFEESGLQTSTLYLCGTVLIETGQEKGVLLQVFWGEYEGGSLINSEEGELEWVNLSEINNYDIVEDLQLMISKILKTRQTNVPFSAHYSYDENDHLVIRYSD